MTRPNIDYYPFHNSDPPRILDLWNRSVATRGFGKPARCDTLEQLVFSKPYFDRAGVQLAFAGDRLVGFAHAGFGCNDRCSEIDTTMGTIGMLMVDPEYRQQGIGTRLLQLGQQYLRDRGAHVQYVGALYPLNPFYLGLYGGSELPGILETDVAMTMLVTKHGYVPADTCLVFQRSLASPAVSSDNRIPLLRRQVEILVEPWPMPPSWWHACILGNTISLRYEMVERATNQPIGAAWVWEMETFGRVAGTPMVGIADFHIQEARRGHGFGKLLLYSVLKHLTEQRIGLVEAQTMQRNPAGQALYRSLGFEHVDTGHIYRLAEA